MAQNFLEAKLVFWQYQTTAPLDRREIDGRISNAVTGLCNINARSWRYNGTDEITGADGNTKLCVTIQHHEFNGEDPRRESALESLCEVLFYERSVLALDPILADGRFLMGPFSETSMIETDRIFGINFARESLAHLQRTSGLGATMQKHVRQSDRFIGRNATKWFHAPLYAGLCVTNLFIFFDDVFEGVDPENLNKLDTLCDKDMKAILEKGKHILKCAKVFSEWAPEVRKRAETILNELDQDDKKAVLKRKANSLIFGKKELQVLVQNLGGRDPSVIESHRIVGSLSGMMTECVPLYDAISNYSDTCVANVVKNVTFAASGLLLAGAAIFVPVVGPVASAALFGGGMVGGGVLGGFGVATIYDGIDLHNSRQFKCALHAIYMALTSCRLFLLLILINTQGCLDPSSPCYQEFKAAINKQCQADVELFSRPGYINSTVKSLVSNINKGVIVLQEDLKRL